MVTELLPQKPSSYLFLFGSLQSEGTSPERLNREKRGYFMRR